MTPLQFLRRGPLHRRLFAWFALTVVVTSVVVGLVVHFVIGPPRWAAELNRVRDFASLQFSKRWHDELARDELLLEVSQKLEVRVELHSTEGELIAGVGDYGCPGKPFRALIEDVQGRPLGELLVCNPRFARQMTMRGIVSLLVAVFMLWLGSWLISRLLAAPLRDLALVAERLGDGDLDARTDTSMRQINVEYVVVAEAFDEMAERISQQIREQRTLLAAVSHEMRTPLGHLRLIIELARVQEGGISPKQLAELEAEIVEMDELVDQLLANSRLNVELHSSNELNPIELAIQAVERAGLEPDILEVDGEIEPIHGDSTLLLRALANLLRNAEQHGEGVSRLLVERRGAAVAFLVEDDGPGLPHHAHQRLFEAFVQDNSDGSGSLGLGLFLVKRVAQAHQGDVLAEAAISGGASVGFVVPCIEASPYS